MADHSKTPSPISSIQDSYRPNYDSHESLGYQQMRRRTYSLANSVSGPEEHQSEIRQENLPESEAFMSGINMSSDPASNTAADMSMTSIALADDDDDRTRSINTTRILQKALDSNPKWDSGLETFTDYPPRGVRHADYNKYVEELPDDMSAYTQVLIWCLARRIEHLRKAPPEKLRVSLLLVNVLQNLQHKLQARLVTPTTAYREPLKLKPKMENPTNKWYSIVKDRLKTAHDKIHETTRESYNIAGEYEKLSLVDGMVPIGAETPQIDVNNMITQSNNEARKKIKGLLESITNLDGLSMQARETIYETVELRERLQIAEGQDPIAVLRATEFQQQH